MSKSVLNAQLNVPRSAFYCDGFFEDVFILFRFVLISARNVAFRSPAGVGMHWRHEVTRFILTVQNGDLVRAYSTRKVYLIICLTIHEMPISVGNMAEPSGDVTLTLILG